MKEIIKAKINKQGIIPKLKLTEENREFLKKLEERTSYLKTAKMNERAFHVLNELYSVPVCKHCKKETKFLNSVKGYQTFCSNKCAGEYKKKNFKKVFIEKYGEVEGKIKYEEFKKSRKHDLEFYITKYGNEGLNKYESFRKKMSYINSKKRYIEEGRLEDFFTLLKIKIPTLERFMEKYGKKEGKIKYIEKENKRKQTLKNYIAKYGEEKGKEIWKRNCANHRNRALDVLIKKHGLIKGVEIYKDFANKIKATHTLKWYIDKYGEEKGQIMFDKRYGTPCKASKRSLKYFIPLYKLLRGKRLLREDLKFGLKGSREMRLNNYYYDFTICSKKIIFEYNGIHVHPKPTWLKDDIEKWNRWRNLWTKKSADECLKRQQDKIKLANEKGFTVIELWSDESYETNWNKIKEVINSL